MTVHDHARRTSIFQINQHPYRHSADEFFYSNAAIPNVSNMQSALDWLFAVNYPQTKASVATVAALPSVGNTINDYRVVLDDGDGKAASYRWEQREGESSASWHKIYDMDWGQDSILSAFLLKTQDVYVYRFGYDDIDASGNVLTGVDAGQHIFGGHSASTNLTLHANSGDGTGAQTGYVQLADHMRPTATSSWTLGTTANRWLKVWTDALTVSTMTLTGGSLVDSSGTISFGSTNLTTSGTLHAGSMTATSATFGSTLSIASGAISDSGGTINFSATNLTTTGDVTATHVKTGTLTVADGSIADSDGTINFGGTNFTSVGNIGAGNITSTRLDVDNIRLDLNTISITNTGGNLVLSANGSGVVNATSAMTTIDQTVTGTLSVTGQLNADNLRLDGNTLSSTDTNGDIIIDPNGSGLIQIGAAFYPQSSGSWDIGKSASLWNKLWISGSLGYGANSITIDTLLSLKDINSGASNGMTLFFDGSKWNPSIPDTEVDHGSISGLADDDHTQYLLLAGRSGGQSVVGGTAASNNLTLESTSNGTKGKILTKDTFAANTDASFSVTWSGTDLGGSSNRFRHVYTAGEFFGMRLENLSADPSPASSAAGRIFWQTTDSTVKVDTGTAIQRIGIFRSETDTSWDGSTSQKDVTVSAIDATKAIWVLKDNTNNYEQMPVKITATTTTNVRIITNVPLPSGTYRLIGLQ